MPPEKYRLYASISFAFLLLGIGVPLWWHTTAVPRVTLPYSGIAELSNLNIKIRGNILVATTSEERAQFITNQIRTAFENSTLYSLKVSFEVISKNLVNSAFTQYDHEKIARTFDIGIGDLLFLEAPNLNEIIVGHHRAIFFPTQTDGSKLVHLLSHMILRDESLILTRNAMTDPTKYSLDEENRRRFPPSSTYDILLTVVNPNPDKLSIKWNLSNITRDYLEPFLDQLSVIANFSVKSQWLYLMPLDITPKQIPDSSELGRHYALSESILPQLITPLEKKLASQVSLHPCINLVMYTVPCDQSPLYIYTKSGHKSNSVNNVKAFLSPRWGGVVISNSPTDVCKQVLEKNDDKPVEVVPNAVTIMGVFLSQLRLLLGIPEPNYKISGVTVTPTPGESILRDWEFDLLLRVRAIEQLTSAKLTLQSLAQLLEEISNIVITETVGNRIKSALDLIHQSAEKLLDGELMEGFSLSKESFVTAEMAFTDPSLLALLYFPDDQKYAVYIPLFLPVMIPVLLSLKNISRYFLNKNNS
ncbi:GPI transamidase component PIG-S isoform X2 [Microplitis mediator]|uniref:GPI transamidase component PIG-S isoform X2 n=1 Tax=Microplitis mediator TaxID=375433 RepID=UPI0025564CEA|nr:GPI transamidase component PIG-S isoform X2 [Microplitis mediator]